jgi:hypothetical protein
MQRLLDFDPITGESVIFTGHGNGTFSITHQQSAESVESILEHNRQATNLPEYTKRGFKQDWWHYARIPNIIALKWRNELGIDIFNRDHKKKIFQLLNSPEYKYLKTTSKHHALKR